MIIKTTDHHEPEHKRAAMPPPAVAVAAAPAPTSAPSGGSNAHKQTVTSLEGVRQSTVQAAGSNVAAIKTAEINFYRGVANSAIASNNGQGIEPALTALRGLGVTLSG